MKKLIFALIMLLLPSMAMAFPPMPKGASVGGVNVWTGTNTWTGTATFDDITVGGGNINTGNIPLIIGDNTTDSITLRTDGGDVTVPEGTITLLDTTTAASTYAPIASPALTGDSTLTDATPTLTLQDSDNAAGTAGVNFNSSGGANDVVATVGVEDSTGASTPYQQWDGVTETVDFLKNATLLNEGVLRTSETIEGHTFAIQVYDNTANQWKPALTFTNGITGAYKVTLGSGATFDGLGSLSLGGVELGTANPISAGQIGFASNAFGFFSNSEDLDITATSNLWTFSSTTDATFAFTPAVAFTASASVGTTLNPDAADGAAIGTTALEWSDIYFADGGVIYFGNDQDVTLTHNADTGLTLNTSSFVTGAATDPYVYLNETDGTDWYMGVDDTGNTLEFRTNATVGNSVQAELDEDGDVMFTGAVKGKVDIITDADGRSVAAAECYGSYHIATGAGTWTLPSAVAGMNLWIYCGAAANIVIDCDAGDNFVVDGVAESDGEAIDSDDNLGEWIHLVAISVDEWHTMGVSAGWTGE